MDNNAENVRQARESFDRILNNEKYAGIIKDDRHLSLLLDLADGSGSGRILDIGTGTGYLAFPLAEKYPEATVCGIDIAETVVEKNNAAVRDRGLANLTFVVFDGLKYPFSDASFDLIVTRYAFHHFPDVEDAIRQMSRILEKGGKVLIADPMRSEQDENGIIDSFMRVKRDGHIQFYSLSELERMFTDNGFVKEKQVITEMSFPFAPQKEYTDLYEKTTDKDRQLYGMTREGDIVRVKHIHVGNTVFVKK